MESKDMRTEELRDFDKRLSAINKNFAHSLFLSEQFVIDNSELISSNPEALSGKVYTNNPYSKSFNYRLKDIPEAINDYRDSAFTSFYLTIYSTFDLYVENLFTLVSAILPKSWRRPDNTPTLYAIFLYLGSIITNHIDQNELETLDYIRWRRNSLVHADGKPSPSLSGVIKNKGRKLNLYWQNAGIKLTAVDFASKRIDQFHSREIVDIIQLLRAVAKKIDQEALTLLKKANILDYILRDFKVDFAKEINERPRARVENIFAAIAKRKFDIDKKDINFVTLAL
jgi:hypothetical protein